MKEWISGRNPVYECLRAGRRHFFRLLLAKGIDRSERVDEILSLAARRKLAPEQANRDTLDGLADNHQGVALQASMYPYVLLEDIFTLSETKKETLLMLVLDQIQDPQNLGALIRSAEVFGSHGILLPPSRSAGITPAVVHASSGASELLLIAQANLAQAMNAIKERGAWVIGLDMDSGSQPLTLTDLSGPIAIVVGSEGAGLRRLVRERCDLIAHIPMKGRVASLNAAVAGSIALYHAAVQR